MPVADQDVASVGSVRGPDGVELGPVVWTSGTRTKLREIALDENRNGAEPPRPGGGRGMQPAQLLVLLLAAGVLVAGAISVGQVALSVYRHITFPYEMKGWAEGHFLHSAMQLLRGETIYVDPAEEPVVVMPYGFLYFFVLAPLIRVFGPELWIPRAVSAAAALLSLACVFFAATRRGGSAIAGACAVALACTSYWVVLGCWDWGHADSLYIALGLGALMCVERVEPSGNARRIVLASLLSWGSFCAKQTGAGFALAITASLFFGKRRRQAALYAVLTGSLLLATWFVGHVLTHGQFDRQMLLVLADPYYPSRILDLARILVGTSPVLLLAGGWQIGRILSQSTRWADPLLWGLIGVGVPSAAAFIKLAGTDNNLMPLLLFLSALAGVRFSQMVRAAEGARWVRPVALGGLLVQLVLTQVCFTPWDRRELAHQYLCAGRLIEAELQDPNDRVLVGFRVSYAIRAQRPVYDTFPMVNYGHEQPGVLEEYTGKIRKRLGKQIAEQFFDKILIPVDSYEDLHRDLRQFLNVRYRLNHVIRTEYRLPEYTPMLVFRPAGRVRVDEAIACYERTLSVRPTATNAYAELGALLAVQGRPRRGLEVLRQGVARAGPYPRIVNNLAWILSTYPDAAIRDGREAVSLVRGLGPVGEIDDVSLLDTIGAAYAETGAFAPAIAAAERALQLAKGSDHPKMALAIEGRLRTYRSGRPYHETQQ